LLAADDAAAGPDDRSSEIAASADGGRSHDHDPSAVDRLYRAGKTCHLGSPLPSGQDVHNADP
jgi:hypothetical protein